MGTILARPKKDGSVSYTALVGADVGHADYCLRDLRLNSLTSLSAALFDVPDFLFIFAS